MEPWKIDRLTALLRRAAPHYRCIHDAPDADDACDGEPGEGRCNVTREADEILHADAPDLIAGAAVLHRLLVSMRRLEGAGPVAISYAEGDDLWNVRAGDRLLASAVWIDLAINEAADVLTVKP